ncbi:hypothetical protein TSUD_334990 [Trifolium subterraneum]|uniref:Uncharacterized protein n=1 Tax=Trifolium subterraneum TaxID=3900 RepID=A0A2Z6NI27_TRISU|nr:hypothetical protein TSUD_334990 [Trifolium subterraneum]
MVASGGGVGGCRDFLVVLGLLMVVNGCWSMVMKIKEEWGTSPLEVGESLIKLGKRQSFEFETNEVEECAGLVLLY